MKRAIIGTVIIFLLLQGSTFSLYAESKFGAGFILGDPSGITAKFFIDDVYALDIGLGPSAYDGFYFYVDFLRHLDNIFPVKELVLYVGIGAGFQNRDRDNYNNNKKDDEDSLELRMPFGVEYTFKEVPVGLFAEIAPSTEFIPDFDFNIRGGTGARYYF